MIRKLGINPLVQHQKNLKKIRIKYNQNYLPEDMMHDRYYRQKMIQ